jgi:deoxyribodipyrimidine photo-lyase
VHRDYTPFSRQRDEQLRKVCEAAGRAFHSVADLLLHEPEHVLTQAGTPFHVFTPFWRQATSLPTALPQGTAQGAWATQPLPGERTDALDTLRPDGPRPTHTITERAAQDLLRDVSHLRRYEVERDIPALDATSHLSAHLKFGTTSVRAAYAAVREQLGSDHPVLRQFFWRDFFTHVAWHHPHVFGHAFQPVYEHLAWRTDSSLLQRWQDGSTGFPLVDAGMRQLRATGDMPNRVRMVVASFLCKDLHLDWRLGEQHFAQYLLDYDPCVNNGNWQWAASTGCDAQPYFRIFNPWLQQRKFDPEARYIRTWVPELSHVDPEWIHSWEGGAAMQATSYPRPIVDHRTAAQQSQLLFQQARQAT